MTLDQQLVDAARRLAEDTGKLRFAKPVTHVYNPLIYAWDPHELYLRRFGRTQKEIIFLGMNPGPYGMAQTGVPFGEVTAVRDWMKITARVERPAREHPKRPVHGFDCPRSEISGQRLWSLFGGEFGKAEQFFQRHFVVNYCPLAFLEETGRNRTPDKLRPAERRRLEAACDAHLRRVLEILAPRWVIGVGDFATRRARLVSKGLPLQVGQILHPSPASPLANRNWGGTVKAQMQALGLWARAQIGQGNC